MFLLLSVYLPNVAITFYLPNHNQACTLVESSGYTCIGIKAIYLIGSVTYNSCNTGTCDLPDMYARSLQAPPSGFGHAYQANHSCPCYKINI